MSHSGNDNDRIAAMHAALRHTLGEFPDGRLNEHDQGTVPVAIGHQDGRVVMQFPKNLNWIGFTADEAIDIAESLVEHARSCGSKKPLTFKIG